MASRTQLNKYQKHEYKEHKKTLKYAMQATGGEKPNANELKYYARLIALDHLKEDRNYYRKLKKVGL